MNSTIAAGAPPQPTEVDPRVQGLLRLIARYLSAGVSIGDFTEITSRITGWDDWPREWSAAAVEHETAAEEARRRGNRETVVSEFLQAAALHHFGWYLAMDDMEAYFDGMARSAEDYRSAIESSPGSTSVSVQFDYAGASYHGYLRRPVDGADGPVVLLIPGLDASAVEMHGLSEALLARGLGTFAFDGPGQGLSRRVSAIEPRFEGPVSAALDALEVHGVQRFGILGVSLGGYYAPRAAAFESRIAAAVAVCGPFDFGRVVRERGQVPLQARALRFGFEGPTGEGSGTASDLDLARDASRIRCPLLVVHARADHVIPGSEGEDLARAVPHSELIMYERADHVCHNIAPTFRAHAADWLAEQLGSGAHGRT